VLLDARESETDSSSPEANSRTVSEQKAAQADFKDCGGLGEKTKIGGCGYYSTAFVSN